MPERLQKIISAAGIASRRASEQLMLDGRVTVNGATIRELGTKADAAHDDIRVDGRRVKLAEHHRYVLLNKPRGYMTTRSDPQRRPTVLDLLRGVKEYLYPVGRLDFETEGLLLMTNSGELFTYETWGSEMVPSLAQQAWHICRQIGRRNMPITNGGQRLNTKEKASPKPTLEHNVGTRLKRVVAAQPIQTGEQQVEQKKSLKKTTEGASGGVNTAANLLTLAMVHPGLNVADLVRLPEKPQRTIERWIKQFKDQDFIEFRGATKTGGYYSKGGKNT